MKTPHGKIKGDVDINRSSQLLKNLFKQRTEGILCDVELRLQDNVIKVHGCVLASQSEYFMERFCSQLFRDASVDKHWCSIRPLVIDLNSDMDMDNHCFKCLSNVVDYIYLNEFVAEEGHVTHYYRYASFFKILGLLALCKTLDKTLFLDNDPINKVKPSRVRRQMGNNPKEYLTHEGVSQDAPYSEAKCEFVCCSGDVEPSVKHGENNKRRSIFCELCSFKTVSMKAMIKHVESLSHFGTMCPICRFKLSNVSQFKDHFKLHVGAKPYICHICNKRNRFWEQHKLHLRVHCQNKPFYCSICQTRFKEKKNLVSHMRNHPESCYSCEHCGYLTSDFELFKSHITQHSAVLVECGECLDNSCGESSVNKALIASQDSKKIVCHTCGKGFTMQKNLKRHVLLEHFSEAQGFKCPKCDYRPKRLDMLKKHMLKIHQPIESLDIEKTLKLYKNCKKLTKSETIKKRAQSSDICGVLIPVQLVSAGDRSTLNAFAVKAGKNSERSASHENDNLPVALDSEEFINSIEISSENFLKNQTPDELIVNETCENNIDTNLQISTVTPIGTKHSNDSLHEPTGSIKCSKLTGDGQVLGEGQVQLSLAKEGNSRKEGRVATTDEIWLNESTGELLSGNGYVNLRLLNSERSVQQDISSLRQANLDVGDPFNSLLLNDQSGEIAMHELTEMKDGCFSNPQTPQANVFDLEDSENLISWNCLESPFCSTWVLNEATGELNMVSFSIQSFNSSEKLQINKNSEGLPSVDDDDTALFLNEGTGDLSVIYFNPEGQLSGAIGQDALETMSDHSDDEDIGILNEELLRVTANFMADDGNEKFLNELTGEFDVASFSQFQTDVLAYQTPINSMYLNEETGEISWNVMDQDANSDIVTTNSDILNLDFDDSMNCDELDGFPSATDFSSEFCMESSASSNWQNVNGSCDTLLNECTGELVQKI